MYNIRAVFGENVRFYRKLCGFTQEELAENMKVDSGYVSKVERGTINVSFEYVRRFSIALKVSVSELFEERN